MLAPCYCFGSSEEEHDQCLKHVMKIFEGNNVLLNRTKCVRKVKALQFLGHKLSDSGINADEKKIKTFLEFRSPKTKGD